MGYDFFWFVWDKIFVERKKAEARDAETVGLDYTSDCVLYRFNAINTNKQEILFLSI